MASPENYSFDAAIYSMGLPRCVDVPAHISEALGGETYIPVVVRVGEATAHTTLSPKGGGQHRLFVSSALRRASGTDIGDRIQLTIHRDTASREAALPDDVRAALEQRSGAIDAFLRLSPSGKRWFVDHIESAKTEATRQRRIQKDIELIIKRG